MTSAPVESEPEPASLTEWKRGYWRFILTVSTVLNHFGCGEITFRLTGGSPLLA